jgi:hypothetical protein
VKGKEDRADTSMDISLDEEALAQIDELIEKHSTPLHRLTREEMLHLLLEKGRELVAQGESLRPHLEPPASEEDEAALSSRSAPDDTEKH